MARTKTAVYRIHDGLVGNDILVRGAATKEEALQLALDFLDDDGDKEWLRAAKCEEGLFRFNPCHPDDDYSVMMEYADKPGHGVFKGFFFTSERCDDDTS